MLKCNPVNFIKSKLFKSKLIQSISAIIISLFLASCAIKPPVTSDYDTSYNFSTLKTYAWIESEQKDHVSTLDNKRQRNAIETILNRKGFEKVTTSKQADFLLKSHSVTDKKTDVDRFYQTWGYHPFYHPNVLYPHFNAWPHNTTTIVREYQIGTLVLDIVDPTKKQVIWRGSVSKPLGIYKNITPEERSTIELSNADYMLASFPPGRIDSQ